MTSADSLSAGTSSGLDDDQAGARPNTMAVAIDTVIANASTERSIEKLNSIGIGNTVDPNPDRACPAHHAIKSPSEPPTIWSPS